MRKDKLQKSKRFGIIKQYRQIDSTFGLIQNSYNLMLCFDVNEFCKIDGLLKDVHFLYSTNINFFDKMFQMVYVRNEPLNGFN